jgi:hypothetical protein
MQSNLQSDSANCFTAFDLGQGWSTFVSRDQEREGFDKLGRLTK